MDIFDDESDEHAELESNSDETGRSSSLADDAEHQMLKQQNRALSKLTKTMGAEILQQRSATAKAESATAKAESEAAASAKRASEAELRIELLMRETADLKQKAVALQINSPEAAQLWTHTCLQLKRQSTTSEIRRRKNRALAKKILRRTTAEQREVPADYSKIARHNLGGPGEPGGKVFMTLDSIAKGAGPNKEAAEPGIRKKREWSCTKVASKHVMVKLPGSSTSRIGELGTYIGGLESNPERLLPMMMNFCKNNLSIRSLASSTSYELEMMSHNGVYVNAERHSGGTNSTRKSFPGTKDKPLEVLGSYCETTLTHAIHAFQMTVDRFVSKQILLADGIHFALDISTFATNHMQSLYLAAWWVETLGFDAAGNPIWIVRRIEGFGPAIAVGEKLSRQLLDKDGNLFSTATTQAAATSIMLADLLGVLDHPCVSLGVDGGGEGQGVDDPSSKGNSRANKNGLGSYRNELFVTRAAFHQAMTKDCPVLTSFMDLNNLSEDHRQLAQKRDRPKTLDPVHIFVSNSGVLWHRTRDMSYTRDTPVWTDAKVKEELPPRRNMTKDPLVSMALVKGGVPIVGDCFKHLGHIIALYGCKAIIPFTQDLASVILAIDNVWIFTRLKTVLGKVFALEGCGPISTLQAAVAKRLREINPKLFAAVQARYTNAKQIPKLAEACTTRWGAIGDGAEQLEERLPELAVIVVLTFSSGLHQNRVDASVSVWSKGGLRHNDCIQLSPKLGKLVYRMNHE